MPSYRTSRLHENLLFCYYSHVDYAINFSQTINQTFNAIIVPHKSSSDGKSKGTPICELWSRTPY